ncbi:FCRL5 protein, partial [Atractosteus spatula]|nr:FCRL5 protein [Atractosteus spatula]
TGPRYKAVLTADPPWTVVFPGETVTLNCHISGPGGWKYYWALEKQGTTVPLKDSSGEDSSQYILSSVSESDGGKYWCQAERGNEQSDSDSHTLAVSNVKASAVVIIDPPDSVVFSGETVTLSCVVKGASGGWRYSWARKTKGTLENLYRSSAEDQQNYTLSPVTVSDSGQYWCQAERGNKLIIQTHPGFLILKVSGPPKSVLTLELGWMEVFITESVTMRCDIQLGSKWIYEWYRDGEELLVDRASSNSINGNRYTILSTAQSDRGNYACRGHRSRKSVYSATSNAVTLQLTSIPKPVLSLETAWTEFYTGEIIFLKCCINSTEWTYDWYRDGQKLAVDKSDFNSNKGNRYTIPFASQSNKGSYTCRGQHNRRSLHSETSNAVTLEVSEILPKPNILQDPPSELIYTEDTVTLGCGFGGHSTGWKYLWHKDTQALSDTHSVSTDGSCYKISSAALSDSGEYRCRALRGKVEFYSLHSDPLKLEIRARAKAALTLESGWTEIFMTERVTLRCEIQGDSTEWIYTWYRNGQELPRNKTASSRGNEDTYTILSAEQSHSREYICKVKSNKNSFFFNNSNSVTLKVSEKKPKPILTQDPPIRKIYTGDRVALSCGFLENSTGWEYLWYKEPVQNNTESNRTVGSNYTIDSAVVSNSGEYRCQARRGTVPFHSQRSDTLTLNITVEARPQAVITLETAWTKIFITNNIVLRCEVQASSIEWNYTWYRDGSMSDLSSRNGDRYTVISDNELYKSAYTCRGERITEPFYSVTSDSFVPQDIRELHQSYSVHFQL